MLGWISWHRIDERRWCPWRETVIWSPVGLQGGSASSCQFQEQHGSCLSFDPRNPGFAMKFLLPWNDCSILFDFQQLFHLFLYPVKLSSDSSEAFTHRFLPASITPPPCLYIFPPHIVFAYWTVTVFREWRISNPAVVSISRLWLLLRGNLRLHRLISILMWRSPEDLTGFSRIKDTYIARNNLSSNRTPQRKCSFFKSLPTLLKTVFF